jgi:PHS family inorganic phosphate transporter-like MFS transporter
MTFRPTRTAAVGGTISSVVFVGSILGQLCMGVAGDAWGRKRALILTNIFTTIGALCSALCAWGPATTVYAIITASRFLLGVGVGGKYPLSGTISSESKAVTKSKMKSALEVALGFFWQTPGSLLPYAVGMAFLAATHLKDATSVPFVDAAVGFRVVLGLGALPAMVVVILTVCQVRVPAPRLLCLKVIARLLHHS